MLIVNYSKFYVFIEHLDPSSMKYSYLILLLALLSCSCLFIAQSAYAQLAFPGAEGFGATTPGGRGGAGR